MLQRTSLEKPIRSKMFNFRENISILVLDSFNNEGILSNCYVRNLVSISTLNNKHTSCES